MDTWVENVLNVAAEQDKEATGGLLGGPGVSTQTFTAKSLGSVPGQGAQVAHDDPCGYKRREEEGLAATVPLPGERRLGG